VPQLRSFFHTLTGARDVMLLNKGKSSVTFFPNHDGFRCGQVSIL
jgi:hypothetical protein